MPPVIITADNIPDALAQITARQNEQEAAIELLAGQLADNQIRTEEQGEALRTQAAALRVTTARLARNIADAAKAAGRGNGAGAKGDDRSAKRPPATADDDDGNANDSDDAGNRLAAPRGRSADITDIASARAARGKPVEAKATPPEEPKPPTRKRAHRWI